MINDTRPEPDVTIGSDDQYARARLISQAMDEDAWPPQPHVDVVGIHLQKHVNPGFEQERVKQNRYAVAYDRDIR